MILGGSFGELVEGGHRGVVGGRWGSTSGHRGVVGGSFGFIRGRRRVVRGRHWSRR